MYVNRELMNYLRFYVDESAYGTWYAIRCAKVLGERFPVAAFGI